MGSWAADWHFKNQRMVRSRRVSWVYPVKMKECASVLVLWNTTVDAERSVQMILWMLIKVCHQTIIWRAQIHLSFLERTLYLICLRLIKGFCSNAVFVQLVMTRLSWVNDFLCLKDKQMLYLLTPLAGDWQLRKEDVVGVDKSANHFTFINLSFR